MRAVLRGLLRRRARTLSAMAGVAIGYGAYLVLVSSAADVSRRFGARVASTGAEMAVRQAGVGMAILSRIRAADVPRIAEVARAQWASGVLVQLTRLPNGVQMPVFGVDAEGPVADLFTLDSGRRLLSASREALLGRSLASARGRPPGPRIEVLPGHAYPVRGVFASGNAFLDGGCALELPEAQRLFGMEEFVSLVLVKLRDPARLPEAIAAVRRDLPHLHATASELYFTGFHELEAVEGYARALGVAALAVSVLGVASVMARSVAERREELAILRAVGWSRARVARTVLAEGFALAAMGGAAGLFSAWLFLRAASATGLSPWLPPGIPAGPVLEGAALLAFSVGVGCVPALLGSWGTQPASDLR